MSGHASRSPTKSKPTTRRAQDLSLLADMLCAVSKLPKPHVQKRISFCLSEGLQKRQQHTFLIKRTASTSLLPHPYEYFIHDERAFSACRSTPRSRTASVLIEVQPASSATKLRRISIARHGAIVCTACHKSRRLDTFPFAVAATVAPAQNQPSASFFNKGILIFQIVRDW